jgi:DNA-binding NarL/FixJ family response regulator
VDIAPLPNSRKLANLSAGSSLVPAIRTVVVTMSPIFRNLVTELMIRHRCLNVVAELDTREGLEERLRSLAPNLILIGLHRNEGDEIGLSLLHNLLNAKVIAFSSDARHAFVQRMQPQCTVLRDVSPQMLIDAILAS